MHSNFHPILEEVPDQGGVDRVPHLLLHQPVPARPGEDALNTPSIHGEVLHLLPHLEGNDMSPHSCISLNTPGTRIR